MRGLFLHAAPRMGRWGVGIHRSWGVGGTDVVSDLNVVAELL